MIHIYILVLLASLFQACRPHKDRVHDTNISAASSATTQNQMEKAIEVKCVLRQVPEKSELWLDYEVKNLSNVPVHLFVGDRMPYKFQQEDGSVLILQGVNAPDPEMDYYFIEIPLTRALEPGATAQFNTQLHPFVQGDHYGTAYEAANLHGELTVGLEVGWSATAITEANRHTLSIQQVLQAQHLVAAAPIQVRFP